MLSMPSHIGKNEMERKQILTRYARKEHLGIEIAPWFRPLVPRSEGYNSRNFDIFDREKLVKIAIDSGLGYMSNAIENVSFLGNAVDIRPIVQKEVPGRGIYYLISSHNFEHLPNPIQFLSGCCDIMVDGGYLSMAIPDKRCTFDYFRPISTTADFLAAYFEKRTKPTMSQWFEQVSMESHFVDDDGTFHYGFSLSHDPSKIHPGERLERSFREWQAKLENAESEYQDAHCWTFTPSSFELIIRDLSQLGLINFSIADISEAAGNEFFVHLRNHLSFEKDVQFYTKRKSLLRNILIESSANVPAGF
jgi:hypothetical protein